MDNFQQTTLPPCGKCSLISSRAGQSLKQPLCNLYAIAAFVILPYEEFVMIEEELQQFEDLKQLREAKTTETDSPTVPLDDVKKDLGL